MGLAASQARLLTITARKADCEFESMALSHQKLALSRDMERVSTEYQNALNQTKLVYDYYGSGDKQLDLTYGLFMEPSIYNDYVPKLVTDPTNRVILNAKYAAAARAAGIPAEGLLGLPSIDVRDAFVDALLAEGIITQNKADAIKRVPYNNGLGLGNTISATIPTKDISYNELLELIQNTTTGTGAYGLEFADGNYKISGLEPTLGSKHMGFVDSEGNYNECAKGKSVSLNELLGNNQNYIITALSRGGDQLPICDTRAMQEELVQNGGFLDWMMEQFESILGGVEANQIALDYAYNCVYDLIHPNGEIEEYFSPGNEGYEYIGEDGDPRFKHFRMQDEGGGWYNVLDTFGINIDKDVTEAGRIMLKLGTLTDTTSKFDKTDEIKTDSAKKASDYLGFTYTHDKNNSWWTKDSNDMSQVSISLNNIAQAFLTSFVQYMQGIEDSDYNWQFGAKADPSVNLYNGLKDKDVMFTIAQDAEIEDGDSKLYANFYDTLFNRICMNGWVENDNVDDKEYMQELLKNGMAFISSVSGDCFYYQGNYATDRTIL